jgi:DNA-directed RNA polymerase specialized sigma24 family protein
MLPPFQHLLDGHAVQLHRLCLALVGPDDADDCFQETVIAALRAYPTVRSHENLGAWLRTIARNKARDHHRARRRRAVPAGDLPEEAAPQPTTSAGAWGHVRRLPPKQREAVALRYAAELPFADIADAMGTSEEAARRNVHEGLKTLREVWSP